MSAWYAKVWFNGFLETYGAAWHICFDGWDFQDDLITEKKNVIYIFKSTFLKNDQLNGCHKDVSNNSCCGYRPLKSIEAPRSKDTSALNESSLETAVNLNSSRIFGFAV